MGRYFRFGGLLLSGSRYFRGGGGGGVTFGILRYLTLCDCSDGNTQILFSAFCTFVNSVATVIFSANSSWYSLCFQVDIFVVDSVFLGKLSSIRIGHSETKLGMFLIFTSALFMKVERYASY